MAPVCAALAGFPLSVRVLALRVLNLLLASVAVPAVWFAARRVFANRVAVATAALVVLMPEVMFDAARVANSGLTIALFSALAVLSLEVVDGRRGAALWMGAAFGLGLLAKGLFLCAVPAAAAVLAWAMWKGRLRLRSAVASLGLAVAISAWWYARSLRITGSLSGSPQDAALRHVPVFERLCRLTEVDWRTALDSTFLSHIWFGGWSFLQLRAWIYHFFAVLAVLAAVGLGVAWIRLAPARRHLFALASIYLFFCAGLAYHALTTYLANGMSSTAGWYLCAVVVPEAVLAAVGLRALAPARVQAYTVGVVACALALLDLYGMLFVALPYYTGLIGHKPNGSLEAFHFARLAETGLGEVLRRVATNKPAFIGPAAVGAAACAYIAATAAVAAIALVAEVWRPKADSRATPRPVV
jgi:4-amino-4-deoxy-L-arabinose transferase-like glycosyltransferase